ncbi:MAG TPA: tetratricopeptide repeat protein [Cytophagaceae bacterium]
MLERYFRTCLIIIVLFSVAGFDSVRPDDGLAKELIQKGIEKFENEDFLGAILEFNKAIKKDTSYAEAYYYRAYAKYELEDYKGAIKDAIIAVQKNPSNPDYSFLCGMIREKTGQPEEAYKYYKQATTIDADFFQAYMEMARIKIASKEPVSAIEHLSEAIRVNTESALAFALRGELYLQQNKNQQACNDLNQSLRLGYSLQYDKKVQELVNTYCK